MGNDKSIENKLILRALLHDLANPLSLILNAVSCLEDGGPDMPPPQFFIEKIKKAALEQKSILDTTKALRALFNSDDLMQLSRINLDDVAAFTVERFQTSLDDKGVDLEFAIESEDDAFILAEPIGFQSIVMDALISNALRFSSRGAKVAIEAKRLGDRTEVRVRDMGVGMPRRVYDNLFDLHKRYRMPDLDGNLGLGLGLSLLQVYLERCGATIVVSSRFINDFPQNHGTEIVMSFRAL